MAYVSRDPFARTEIHSRDVGVIKSRGCDWCGQVLTNKKTAKLAENAGRYYLYQYRVESDGGRKNTIKGLFCSAGCMRDYHET